MDSEDIENGFNAFWKVFPRHVEKKASIKAFVRAIKEGAKIEEVVNGAKKYASHVLMNETELRFVKHPTTWLNQGCWDDEYSLNLQQEEKPYEKGSYLREVWRRAENA